MKMISYKKMFFILIIPIVWFVSEYLISYSIEVHCRNYSLDFSTEQQYIYKNECESRLPFPTPMISIINYLFP